MTEIISQLKSLAEAWPAKVAATVVNIVLGEVFQLHLHIFLVFALLEILDCFTKWLALSCKRIKDKKPTAEPTLLDCVRGIPAAHRAHYIKSEAMRKQFANKMLTYLLLIVCASVSDFAIRLIGKPDILLSVVVAYISATEFLSVLENLNDAGVSIVAGLLVKVKQKVGMDKKEGEK